MSKFLKGESVILVVTPPESHNLWSSDFNDKQWCYCTVYLAQESDNWYKVRFTENGTGLWVEGSWLKKESDLSREEWRAFKMAEFNREQEKVKAKRDAWMKGHKED